MENKKCRCKEIMEAHSCWTVEYKITVHLMGCPEDYYTKEYNALSWYKRLFKQDPEELYIEHLSILY